MLLFFIPPCGLRTRKNAVTLGTGIFFRGVFMRTNVKKLVIAALMIALGVLLPMLFHSLGGGTVFLPMHIPVLLCGLLCGVPYGAACG